MIVEIVDGELRYKADTGDWRITLRPFDGPQEFVIEPIMTGELIYASGVNLDHLAQLLVDAKTDALQRGLDWANWGDN